MYEISSEDREQLLNKGYVRLPGALPSELLKRWQLIATRMEAEAVEAHNRADRLHGACVIDDPSGPALIRYDDILGIDGDTTLELLACPAMMAVSREFSGYGTVPLQADILYKQQHPRASVIPWHQGAPHPRGFPYLNVGIYLDDAPEGDGCLRYIPGTQHELQDICKLSQEHGWEIPGVVELSAKAGDILIQDMMVLHGSQPKRSPGVRRTIYVELRPFEGIIESGEQTKHWGRLRQRWMGLVLRRAAVSDWPKDWQKDLPQDLRSDEEEIAAILAEREPPIPAVYCYQPVNRDGYPIPEDLKGW